jgi:lipopolysaccharide exporter
MSELISVNTTTNVLKKAVSGSFFQIGGRFLLRSVKLVRTIIVARFLFPDDVGLFVLASSLLGLAELFLQSGFQSALVQRAEVMRTHLDGVWTIHCIKNIFLGALVYLTAPYAGAFFEEESLVAILEALSLLYIIECLVNIGTVLLQKEMRFGKQLMYDSSYVLTETVATIICAYLMRDVWALVYGALIGRLASVVFSYTFHTYRPRLTMDFSGALELFTFSKWVWITSIFIFILSKIDAFFIGKFLTVSDLGYYQLALSLALIPAVEISRSLATVLFPLFSKLQEQKVLLAHAFTYAYQSIAAVTVPMAVGLHVLAVPIVYTIYGTQWESMIPLLSLLAFYGMGKSFEYVFISYFNSIGKPKIVSQVTILQSIVLIGTIYPCIVFAGIQGVVFALLLTTIASTLLFVGTLVRHRVGVATADVVYLGVPIIASLFMWCVLKAVVWYLAPSLGSLIMSIILGALVYLIVFWMIDRAVGRRYAGILLRILDTMQEKPLQQYIRKIVA